MRRTKEDALATRETLLDAAERLFAQHGVSRTSLQDIARAAGLTRGAVYWHFKDKAELFNAMLARNTLPMEDSLASLAHPEQADALAALQRHALEALARIAHDPRMQRVVEIATHKVEYTDEHEGIRSRRSEVRRRCRDHIQAAFARAQALGQLAESEDTDTMALAYLAMVEGLIHNWMLDPSQFDLVEVGGRSIDLYLRGLQGLRAD